MNMERLTMFTDHQTLAMFTDLQILAMFIDLQTSDTFTDLQTLDMFTHLQILEEEPRLSEAEPAFHAVLRILPFLLTGLGKKLLSYKKICNKNCVALQN
jgi:DNA-binding MltR family transcriptional regulator